MRSHHTDHSDQTTDTENEETVLPPTYMVIKVAKNVPETTTKWLIDKIKGPKKSGGAELIVMMQPSVDDVSNTF